MRRSASKSRTTDVGVDKSTAASQSSQLSGSSASIRLPVAHLFLALVVMFIWGTNFVIAKLALAQFPPFLLAAIRFFLVVVPAIVFTRYPTVKLWKLAAYGLLMGIGQFGALYVALNGMISPGLASLVIQSQVFFTIVLSAAFFSERVSALQLLAIALSLAGFVVIGEVGGGQATIQGVVLVFFAGFSWACANILLKGAPRDQMIAFVVWASVFAVPPLIVISLVTEGRAAIWHAIQNANIAGWVAAVWQAIGNNLFGFAAWGWLLARHPAPVITPAALLVPVFGILASAIWLGEPLEAWKLAAAALVIGGLFLNVYSSRTGTHSSLRSDAPTN